MLLLMMIITEKDTVTEADLTVKLMIMTIMTTHYLDSLSRTLNPGRVMGSSNRRTPTASKTASLINKKTYEHRTSNIEC